MRRDQDPPPIVVPSLNISSSDFVFPGTEVQVALNNSPPGREFLKNLNNGTITNTFVLFGISKGKSFQKFSDFGIFCKVKPASNLTIVLEGLWRGKTLGTKKLGFAYENIEVEKVEDDAVEDVAKMKNGIKDLKKDFSKFVHCFSQNGDINQKKVMEILLALKHYQFNYTDLNNLVWKIIVIIPDLGVDAVTLFIESTSLGERMLYCCNILKELSAQKLKGEGPDLDPITRLGNELESNPELQKRFNRFLEIKDNLSEDARTTIVEDFERLKSSDSTKGYSSEYSMFLWHLDFLLGLPWNIETEQEKNIAKVQEILDQDHACLDVIKQNVCNYIVPKILNPNGKADILCFVGPPGVGKTSLGASIARALNRKFIRISVGGLHDEAEIRGHRVTYIGAKPGRILELLKRCGVRNPVFMIDEIDKVEKSTRGDPSSALLEVLDPEQNHSFVDHYAGIGFDLTQVLFICTANIEETIPEPLRDRMDIIRLPGYLETEKVEIAKRFLIPRTLEEVGLVQKAKVDWPDEAISKLIREYTKEAGVRNLTLKIKDITRKLARDYLERNINDFKVTSNMIESPLMLGPPKYVMEEARPTGIGVAIGLAWTQYGGEILRIQSEFFPRDGRRFEISQTGLPQEVMRQANKVALTLTKKKLKTEDLQRTFDKSLHIHIPEGAVRKDGPSAGITAFCSMYSLFTRRKLRSFIAMTGEIGLEEEVLPIGGVKEKVIAAMRAGIKEVILPQANERNLYDVPQEVKDKIKFHLISSIDQIIEIAFEKSSSI